MAIFTSTTDHGKALKEIKIPKKGTKRLHLVGVKARVSSDITLKSKSKSISFVLKKSPFDGPKGIWVVDISASAVGKATLEAEFKGEVVASLSVVVFEKVLVELPDQSTILGMLTRLFLAESIGPGRPEYNAEESKKAMKWMRLVINNRLKHKTPEIFGVKKKQGKTPYTVYDIIRAPGQFHGFEAYPSIIEDIKLNLTGIVAIANNYNHPAREKYAGFIANAKAAASDNALTGVIDPSKKGLYGWRTKDSKHPGGSFVVFKHLAGQTFYTLKS